MKPSVQVLEAEQEKKIIQEAIKFLENPGIVISNIECLNLLSDAGAIVDLDSKLASIPENLILDAEIIASLKQFSNGIQFRDDPLALDLIREVGTGADFISHEHTFRWFKKEVHYPSPVIDRQPLNPVDQRGTKSAWDRAQDRRQEFLLSSPRPALPSNLRAELRKITSLAAQSEGMDRLPPLPEHP